MKRLIVATCFMGFLIGIPPAIAGGDQRWPIDKQWKRVEAWQKEQAERVKAIERDASSSFNSLGRESKHGSKSGAPPCLFSKRQNSGPK